jgi:hypothetical protein
MIFDQSLKQLTSERDSARKEVIEERTKVEAAL